MGAREERGRIRGVAHVGVVFRRRTVTVARSPLTHFPFIPETYSEVVVLFFLLFFSWRQYD